jgi:uncharacterized cupredoxin-like copper-binding protein
MRLTALLLSGALLAALAVGCSGPQGSEVTIDVHFSRFGPGAVTVEAGRPVTFTLRNQDPIEHEWIVGGPEVHQRHRAGTEPYHDQVPEEVTLPAFSARVTTVTFEQPGDYEFICHLPGHEAYGMKGLVRVVAR